LDVLQHLLSDQQCPGIKSLGFFAARSGSMSMLKWLRAGHRSEIDEQDACAGAALEGQLAALQYLCSDGCEWDAERIADKAAATGNIEVLEWLRQQAGVTIDEETMTWAAAYNQTAMCAHLRSVGCAWDADACDQAARSGHLDVLRWLSENNCPWTLSEVCIGAARYGSTDVLDYALERAGFLEQSY
jgi:hypothetical protein